MEQRLATAVESVESVGLSGAPHALRRSSEPGRREGTALHGSASLSIARGAIENARVPLKLLLSSVALAGVSL